MGDVIRCSWLRHSLIWAMFGVTESISTLAQLFTWGLKEAIRLSIGTVQFDRLAFSALPYCSMLRSCGLLASYLAHSARRREGTLVSRTNA